ncbi:peptidase inhibitor family I36 protein [Nonomuraea sp. NPDC050783]|uniref:peptidase inhibitor family I36 protein n=1 Tax=Nonomuraea sp. NPDC050783 TaxID=3154634 RepID=UPI0034671F59
MPLKRRFAACAATVAAASVAFAALPAGADSPVAGRGAVVLGEARTASGDDVAAAASGLFWLYNKVGYTGSATTYNGDDADFSDNRWPGTTTSMNNGADSARNYSDRDVYLFTKPGYAGAGLRFPPEKGIRDLDDFPDFGRNTASSVSFE